MSPMPRRPPSPPAPLPESQRALFGANLRAERVRARLTQKDLSAATGLTQAYISQVESGVSNITLDAMEKLAEAVGKPVRDLLKLPRRL